MNLAFFRPESRQTSHNGDFEDLGSSVGAHCRAFVHGNADVPYHWHREMEILFVLRGCFRLIVDGQSCEMDQGHMIIINADAPHRSTSGSRDALICGVHFDADYFERMGLPGFGSRQFLCRTFLHGQSFMNRVAPIKALMARLTLEQTERTEEAMVRQAIAYLLACYIYRYIPSEQPGTASNPQTGSRHRILKLMTALNGGSERKYLGEIAAAEGLSLSHLSRLFKRHLGIGYRDFAQSLRLDRSAEDLCTTEHAISDIMQQNDFGNPSVFYRKFRARFGCNPAEFRRGRRLLRPGNQLTEADSNEAQRILATHAAEAAKATDLVLGLEAGNKQQIILNAPHNTNC